MRDYRPGTTGALDSGIRNESDRLLNAKPDTSCSETPEVRVVCYLPVCVKVAKVCIPSDRLLRLKPFPKSSEVAW